MRAGPVRKLAVPRISARGTPAALIEARLNAARLRVQAQVDAVTSLLQTRLAP